MPSLMWVLGETNVMTTPLIFPKVILLVYTSQSSSCSGLVVAWRPLHPSNLQITTSGSWYINTPFLSEVPFLHWFPEFLSMIKHNDWFGNTSLIYFLFFPSWIMSQIRDYVWDYVSNKAILLKSLSCGLPQVETKLRQWGHSGRKAVVTWVASWLVSTNQRTRQQKDNCSWAYVGPLQFGRVGGVQILMRCRLVPLKCELLLVFGIPALLTLPSVGQSHMPYESFSQSLL